MTLPDRFIEQASPAAMYADAGMTVADIVKVVTGVMPTAQVAQRLA